MKAHTFLMWLVVMSFAVSADLAAQVGIGTSEPHSSSKLHIASNTKGVLLPQVALTSKSDVTTINGPADGLLVYNTSEVGTPPDQMTKGYYYWSASSSSWERVGFPRSYGYFMSTEDQTAPSANTIYTVRYDATPIFSSGITIVDGTKITFSKVGLYNLQFSIQYNNETTSEQEVGIWLRKNGVDVANSTTYLTIANKLSSGLYPETVAAWNFFVSATTPGDYYELVWFTTNATDKIKIAAFPAATSPTRPAVPSVLLTVDQVK